jgi:carnitine-CoA ligase
MQDFPLQQRTIGHVLAAKAAASGARNCLIWGGDKYSFADVHALTNRYANGFAAAGVTKGTHVAIMLGNCPEFLWAVWGLGKIGAVAVPLNTAAKGELLRYFLAQSDCEMVIAGADFLARVAEVLPQLPGVKKVFTLDADGIGTAAGRPIQDLKSLECSPAETPPVDAVAFSDAAFIIYTSGTTGPSKGVVSPHAQGINVGRHLAAQYGYTCEDVIYTCLPLFHVNALWYSANAALWADAALALAPRFSVSQFWEDICRTGATQFNALGVMASLLLKHPASAAERAHKVRQSMVVPLSKATARAYSERFGLKVTSLFAATETFAVTILTPGDPECKAASAGHPHGLSDVAVVDDDDQMLAAGDVGEICVRPRAPWISMLGYYKMPEATVIAHRNQWFHTGDRGFLDADGYLWFVDRKKETIRRRGENISAYEVEMLIARHEAVHEVAAVAVASDLSEDDVMVYIVKKPDATLTEGALVEFCAATMSYFMVPRYVAFIDALPKTASEKIEKYKLKQMAEASRHTLWDREKTGFKVGR